MTQAPRFNSGFYRNSCECFFRRLITFNNPTKDAYNIYMAGDQLVGFEFGDTDKLLKLASLLSANAIILNIDLLLDNPFIRSNFDADPALWIKNTSFSLEA